MVTRKYFIQEGPCATFPMVSSPSYMHFSKNSLDVSKGMRRIRNFKESAGPVRYDILLALDVSDLEVEPLKVYPPAYYLG
jgi:hypothetical protein